MRRRDWLGSLGLAAAALSAGSGVARAARHGHGRHASPLTNSHAHFCGIHLAKNNPDFQIITQHYCTAHKPSHAADDESVFQCLLFDSTLPTAKLLGVEYIISEKQYRGLPAAEKKFWHPHTYEVLAGGLTAPEMRPDEELEFMRQILTTWGKTWHTWPDPTSAIPLGEPLLMWSAMADGQIDEALLAKRDRQFNVSAARLRKTRGEALGYAVPEVSLPKDLDAVGRQWTDEGPDVPRPRR